MKLKTLLTHTLLAGLLGLSSTANAGFDFGSPFDWMDDDDYGFNNFRDGGRRGNGGDRWRQYDEWEPNYWRYRYFDGDSNDNFFDEFDGDFMGDGRGGFDFDMNMDMDMDMDSDFDNDYRNRGDRYGRNDRRSDRRNPNQQNDRRDRGRGGDRYNDNQYDDNYWRDYSRQNNGSNRRMSPSREGQRQRNDRNDRRPVECR